MSTQSAPSSPLLRVTDLGVAYGRVRAVQSVSLEVGAGEFVAVIGSNGAGKSSTMKAISGVLAPVAGRIEFNGTDVAGLPSHRLVRAGLAMVPEGRQVFAEQTVEDNLRLGAFVFAATPARIDEAVERGFTLFPRLAERRAQAAGSLSGGEQQMLAIARGLASSPKLLVIDELSLGLAPRVLEMLFPVLESLNRDGLAILLVEQLATQALAVSHRAYVMETGKVTLSGRSPDLARDPAVRQAYLGRA
ncbi:MAG: ABC transporter ATP-binding protein [Betaproteobacteria bacterium]|nr:ABC transporter ATP-binding protein [Betaproteobacteria bacterium]